MKRLATIALLVAIVGGSAFAEAKSGGIARQLSMGGSNAGLGLVVNPFLMHDPSYMLVNPAYQTMYKDYIWMNVGGGTLNGLSTGDNGYGNQFSGVSFAIDREWTFGAILSYDPSFANQVSKLLAGAPSPGFGLPALPAFIADRGAQTIQPIANVWEVMGSYDGKDLDLGFAAMYGSSNNETKNSTSAPAASSSETEASSSVIGFRAGMNMDLGSGSEWGASAALRMDKATDNMSNNPAIAGLGGEYSATGTEIQVQTRLKLKVSNKFSFVPYAMFATISAEPKQDSPVNGGTATTRSEKVTATAIAAGAGGEFKTTDFFLAGGLSFQYAKAKIEQGVPGTTSTGTLTYTAIPVVNLGAEWWFTNWLAGRGGYYRALASTNVKGETSSPGGSGTSETITGLPHSFLAIGGFGPGNYDGIVTLGLGLRFGGFALDATVSEEALRRGFGVIGAQDNINSFGYITTSYNFE
jgi:hypothetical protein